MKEPEKCDCIFSAPLVNELFYEKYDSWQLQFRKKMLVIFDLIFDVHLSFFCPDNWTAPHPLLPGIKLEDAAE